MSVLIAFLLGLLAVLLAIAVALAAALSKQTDLPPVQGNVGIVIAHPDDEAMFFFPTLLSFTDRSKVFLLCLTNGDGDGDASVRKREFSSFAHYMDIPFENLHLCEEFDLRDGFNAKWNVPKAQSLIAAFVRRHNLQTLLTFDDRGVSGHPNHIAAGQCVVQFALENEKLGFPRVDVFFLQSLSLLFKYTGVLNVPRLLFRESHSLCFTSLLPLHNYQAMTVYSSQFRWFRKLFVLFSAYSYINCYSRL